MNIKTMTTMGFGRRRFLLFTVGMAAWVLDRSKLAVLDPSWLDLRDRLSSRLARLFDCRDSARVIGSAYLQRYAQGADGRLLLDEILSDLGCSAEGILWTREKELKALLQERIGQDFADERIVTLQGWILSATEARLCALTTLT